ncbi:hypothetical protein Thein_1929 [Thermodesulfatator indicus DSM 15286]|uniref:Uncharacterized protein n=1 Tax=Thermodesulfatator indicus (strain DSM 15286 / JCM 11887 / CIR29812) TaxID=667014 RepID=F8ACK9_THEID|nr:hypothetical protein [Thermodesulfatator indicus]AEH45784.1 hypothetical protein Thein_1929 [Thermodesulfatator indicus DSM 15286]
MERCRYFFMMAEAASVWLSEGVRKVSSLTRGMSPAHALMFFVMLTFGLIFAADAFAWTTPTPGSFLYDVYDLGVNKILKGPLGFLLGMGCASFGGSRLVGLHDRGSVPAGIGTLLFGGCLIKLDSITQSLGFYV